MIRKSWGGFSALQLAARRPKGLKAIVTVCSTDHRYAYDAHYMGGCLLNGTLDWGTRCFASMALPPDPEMVGKAHWRSTGMTRLENVRSILIDWVTHQREDEAWKHGSVCEDSARSVARFSWSVDGQTAIPTSFSGLNAI
ncbi:hypothetical protein NKH34_31400 [Mesorhizobium sp. M1148]|uniref:CocE/NonD family hydrolase n=1 Tax=unclassified Mesorhizobium TaxID=325217 RepID=UPI003339943D